MLYIMRHGKTDWNALHKMQGRTDIPLNEEGREMAAATGEKYRDLHFDVCYCSPLSRARETAEIFLRGREVPIHADERLMEMSFGTYEGLANSFQIPDCPINKLFFRSSCCNECRVYNWDSFFQYSFLILIPNVYTVILFSLGCASLIKWEIAVHRHPERFYKMSNACLSCEKCDMESCKKNKKKFFSKKLK